MPGDPQFRNLLADATDIFDYNPKIGTEIYGVNLARLTDAQKDDLARLIATRGVVFFRNQSDLDIDAQRELNNYFGKLHKHASTSVPRRGDIDDVHLVYTDGKSKEQRAKFAPTLLWHSDVRDSSPWHVHVSNSSSGDLRNPATILHCIKTALHGEEAVTRSGHPSTLYTTSCPPVCRSTWRDLKLCSRHRSKLMDPIVSAVLFAGNRSSQSTLWLGLTPSLDGSLFSSTLASSQPLSEFPRLRATGSSATSTSLMLPPKSSMFSTNGRRTMWPFGITGFV